jgi:hypothetical protein
MDWGDFDKLKALLHELESGENLAKEQILDALRILMRDAVDRFRARLND